MRCEISNSQIKHDTGKAMLITIPGTKSKFWLPAKLAYDKGYYSIIYLPTNMMFHCIHGKTTKFELSADELADKLSSVNITKKSYVTKTEVVPDKKEAIKREIPEELKR